METDRMTTRPSSILLALDSVHRSLLLNNLKYENAPAAENPVKANATQHRKSAKSTCNHKQNDPIPQAIQKKKILVKLKTTSIKENNNESPRSIAHLQCDTLSTTARSSSTLSSSEYTQCVSSSSSCYEESNEFATDVTADNALKITEALQSAPMLEIVQEMTESRTVTSIVRVNRDKVKRWTNSTTVMPEYVQRQSKRKKKCKQNIINDNVCNEILDKTIKHMETRRSIGAVRKKHDVPQRGGETFQIGKLEAKPKNVKMGGKLLAKRMQRHSTGSCPLLKPRTTRVVDESAAAPPAKPPRTFANTVTNSLSSSKLNSSLDGGNLSSTTVAIGDLTAITPKPNVARKLGWKMVHNTEIMPIPSCPPLSDITPTKWQSTPEDRCTKQKIGWSDPTQYKAIEIPVHIVNMLQFDNDKKNQMISSNLPPQPQEPPTCDKEDIDTVDSPTAATRRSRNWERFSTDTIFSTPQRKTNDPPRCGVANDATDNLCKRCQSKKSDPSSFARKSFGKVALKRTKTFLEASRNILNRSAKNLNPKHDDVDKNDPKLLDLNVSFSTPKKSDTTFQLNQDSVNSHNKTSVKVLGLTPPKPSTPVKPDNTSIESPKRIYEKFLSSVRRTPPKKPIRKSLQGAQNVPVAMITPPKPFDFKRVINSPPRNKDGFAQQLRQNFSLSPKNLFKYQRRHSETGLDENAPTDTYKSFVDTEDDGFVIFMAEYLRKISLEIEEATERQEAAARVRRLSTSSDIVDSISNRVVEIEFHREPEPIYAEIGAVAHDKCVPIYATVNRKPKPFLTLEHLEDTRMKEDGVKNQSQESLFDGGNIDLVGSIENFLEQLGGEGSPLQQSIEVNNDAVILPIREDETVQRSANAPDRKENVSLHREDVKNAQLVDLNTLDDIQPYGSVGMSSFGLTESICEEVLQGNRVNDEIVATMNQLELMSEADRFAQASPESDGLTDDDAGNHSMFNLYPVSIDKTQMEKSKAFVSAKKRSNPATYSQIKKTLRDSFRRGSNFFRLEKSPSKQNSVLPMPDNDSPAMIELSDTNMLRITNQIAHQRSIREQLRHAIEVCRHTSGLECSAELVEAERLMLLSHKKESCAKAELIRIDYDDEGLTENFAQIGFGTVVIRRLEFPMKCTDIYDTIFKYYYVCVCSYRDRVLATYARERCTLDNAVVFENVKLSFAQLNRQFEIKVELFLLRLPHTTHAETSAAGKGVPLLSSSQLFPSHPNGKANNMEKSSNDLDSSRFCLQGMARIDATGLWHSPEYSERSHDTQICTAASESVVRFSSAGRKAIMFTQWNQQTSQTTGEDVQLDYYSEIHFNLPHLKGFLLVKSGDGHWYRRWCWIRGCTLFMSPINQNSSESHISTSMLSVDLTKCINERLELIEKLNESTCRKRMFIIECFNHEAKPSDDQRIVTYSITAQNETNLNQWMRELNRMLQFINDWQI